MNYERYDRLFEEAGRNTEKFDQLLQRAKRERKVASRVLGGLFCVALLLLAWCFYEGWRLFYPFWQAAHSGQPFVIPTVPPRLEALAKLFSTPSGGTIFLAFFLAVYSGVVGIGVGFRTADNRVKTLLLFRGLREGNRVNS